MNTSEPPKIRECGLVNASDSTSAACDTDNDDYSCCTSTQCVYNGICYDTDYDGYTAEITIDSFPELRYNATCSYDIDYDSSAWCPVNFCWRADLGLCVWCGHEACYTNDPTVNTDSCFSPMFTAAWWNDMYDIDITEAEKDCFWYNNTPNDQACCAFFSSGGYDYYRYENIVVY